jgi:hypothetical protein
MVAARLGVDDPRSLPESAHESLYALIDDPDPVIRETAIGMMQDLAVARNAPAIVSNVAADWPTSTGDGRLARYRILRRRRFGPGSEILEAAIADPDQRLAVLALRDWFASRKVLPLPDPLPEHFAEVLFDAIDDNGEGAGWVNWRTLGGNQGLGHPIVRPLLFRCLDERPFAWRSNRAILEALTKSKDPLTDEAERAAVLRAVERALLPEVQESIVGKRIAPTLVGRSSK